jgi:hypothetical protein
MSVAPVTAPAPVGEMTTATIESLATEMAWTNETATTAAHSDDVALPVLTNAIQNGR